MGVGRKEFLGSALAAGSLAFLAPRGLQGAESKVEILINEPIGIISPDLIGAGGRLVYRFAPASVMRLQLTLA